jgi:hypothetical protein
MKHIDSAINKIQQIIKNGKLKNKKVKLKTQIFKKLLHPETLKLIKGADVVHKIKRKAINKETRKHAHDVIADIKAKISKEVGRDLGMDMS